MGSPVESKFLDPVSAIQGHLQQVEYLDPTDD